MTARLNRTLVHISSDRVVSRPALLHGRGSLPPHGLDKECAMGLFKGWVVITLVSFGRGSLIAIKIPTALGSSDIEHAGLRANARINQSISYGRSCLHMAPALLQLDEARPQYVVTFLAARTSRLTPSLCMWLVVSQRGKHMDGAGIRFRVQSRCGRLSRRFRSADRE